ncbi:hypothetical protein CGCF415_v005769 [Colletotrichum fructicola]|nr:hypothetical protein CGCF415_v005769 [Colletotrichum fructicola]KAF5487972.1 hypothetical protein CGCF413_v012178 [Colletotrichum fructicola]
MVSNNPKRKSNPEQQGTPGQNNRRSMSYPHQPYEAWQTTTSLPQPIPGQPSTTHYFELGHSQTAEPPSSPHNTETVEFDEHWPPAPPVQQLSWNTNLAYRSSVGNGNDFGADQTDPVMGDAIAGACYSSSIQSMASTTFTVGSPSPQDFGHIGAWNLYGASIDREPAQEDHRGRVPIQLNLQNLPGKSERSMSTHVNRPSSPSDDEKKKKKKHSKSKRRDRHDNRGHRHK